MHKSKDIDGVYRNEPGSAAHARTCEPHERENRAMGPETQGNQARGADYADCDRNHEPKRSFFKWAKWRRTLLYQVGDPCFKVWRADKDQQPRPDRY
jgi:hypothetical protein